VEGWELFLLVALDHVNALYCEFLFALRNAQLFGNVHRRSVGRVDPVLLRSMESLRGISIFKDVARFLFRYQPDWADLSS
jgi:hypothetical protein